MLSINYWSECVCVVTWIRRVDPINEDFRQGWSSSGTAATTTMAWVSLFVYFQQLRLPNLLITIFRSKGVSWSNWSLLSLRNLGRERTHYVWPLLEMQCLPVPLAVASVFWCDPARGRNAPFSFLLLILDCIFQHHSSRTFGPLVIVHTRNIA